MLDFFKVSTKSSKRGTVEVYPKLIVRSSKDLMIRGGDFYAVWNEDTQLWSTDEEVALYLIDRELDAFAKELEKSTEDNVRVLHMWDAESGMIDKWHKYCQKQMRDNYHALDEKLIFENTKTTKEDYVSKKLKYSLQDCSIAAYDELIGVLYTPEERHKLEWAIGSIISGDSVNIQKFIVLYGSAGTGKSTILNIIQDLFDGYYSVFDAKALGNSNSSFALEAFKSNPLVAIQHDGDLSKIEDNTRLNSVVSHELMTVNEKFKSTYSNKFRCFLFMGTNRPVKITDAKSGILRRLIDVTPSGKKLPMARYKELVSQAKYELGGIALHCLKVYKDDPDAYNNYIPTSMLGASNDFYNYVLDSYEVFKADDGTTLKAAWEMYKTYCEDAKVVYSLSLRVFKEELKNYFRNFEERVVTGNDLRLRNYYSGFIYDKFEYKSEAKIVKKEYWLTFDSTESIFDTECESCPAQYATVNETPSKKWADVTTTLNDLNTSRLHYIKVPENHIVIDFDLCDEDGNKSYEKNLEAANKWPKTYAELSKSGAGIHLHYIYTGDVSKLSKLFDANIEIKTFLGKASLRRKLTKCNSIGISTISSGLPLKGDDSKVVNFDSIKSEKGLRTIIKRNLKKEIHPGTKPSIDFIFKILNDAYNSDLKYDVTDMRPAIMAFAANSTHQADYCLRLVSEMKFKSEEPSVNVTNDENAIAFYDIEVFPNLMLVKYKKATEGAEIQTLINPSPADIENLIRLRLVGFNCRRYDNHILYARLMGYNNEQIYNLSQRIISKSANCFFSEAYNLSYTDIYDYAAKKQTLKKWEIELGIHHQELGLPWDEPVPEELWPKVADYCDNDVIATEAVWNATQGDFKARQILSALSGLSVNDTTNSHTTRIIFGSNRHPELVYTDLSEMFPGYEYRDGKNMYRGQDVGRGGFVYANPGMYGRTITFDVASMHPNSAIQLNYFGTYTPRFKDILDARIAIKHKDFDKARTMLDGKLAPYLGDEKTAKALAQALKIAINSVYGLTSASFDNPFRDKRNVNNIVALRGALFMATLKDEVESRGYRVVHIKTDSIKVENPDDFIVNYILNFGKSYGYDFEVEHIFDRICLVNDAVYIAKLADDDPEDPGKWTATGTQFAVPFVFKTLFSKEPVQFDDLCETKQVQTSLYLDFNEDLPEDAHDYRFVGRIGEFCPIKSGHGGGVLLRSNGDKFAAPSGTKGWRWKESEIVRKLGLQDEIDTQYYINLANDAVATISKYGDFDEFTR